RALGRAPARRFHAGEDAIRAGAAVAARAGRRGDAQARRRRPRLRARDVARSLVSTQVSAKMDRRTFLRSTAAVAAFALPALRAQAANGDYRKLLAPVHLKGV